ncbi:MAG: acyltransferase [Bacteroidota bacterium]
MHPLINEQLQKIKKESGLPAGSPFLYVRLFVRLSGLAWRWVRARWTFRKVKEKGRLVFQNGRMQKLIEGRLTMGNRVRFWSTIMPVQLRVASQAELSIADNCYINGAIIAAHEHISIGQGVYLAPMAHITDSYAFGSPEADLQTAPVHIADHAWIATRAIVLPGVRVGEGAVVGVGALVTEDVPDRAIVGGVPAKVIRYLNTGEERGESSETEVV